MDTKFYLDKIVDLLKEELKHNLVSVILHGSLAMDCFNPKKSDMDLLVIANEPLTKETMQRLAKGFLLIDGVLPNRGGIEISIILGKNLEPFLYPTPFEFHYSAFHRQRYASDEDYICGGFEDGDIAAHVVVAYERGIALYGKPVREVLTPIDSTYYLSAILDDTRNAVQEIIEAPVYYTLNLCRVLYYLKEGVVSSKREGGEWGLRALPPAYEHLLATCLFIYNENDNDIEDMDEDKDKEQHTIEDSLYIDFASYMLKEINERCA